MSALALPTERSEQSHKELDLDFNDKIQKEMDRIEHLKSIKSTMADKFKFTEQSFFWLLEMLT